MLHQCHARHVLSLSGNKLPPSRWQHTAYSVGSTAAVLDNQPLAASGHSVNHMVHHVLP